MSLDTAPTPLQRLTHAVAMLNEARARAAETSVCPICHRAATMNVDVYERALIHEAERLAAAESVEV